MSQAVTDQLPKPLEEWVAQNRPVFDWYANRLEGDAKPKRPFIAFSDLDTVATHEESHCL